MQQDFADLLQDDQNHDVTFAVDNREFKSHKAILSCRSPVFMKMFYHKQMAEASDNKVTIEDIKPAIFETLLKFVYTGNVSLLDDQIDEELFVAADKVSTFFSLSPPL